ncbi:hypothetical protein MUP46_03795 [Patescibacteria group bacterium]|nr:hypothetical protein [Patescibacteria group bacterium]
MSEDKITKTRITTSLGTFEFEGTEEFVEKQIDRIVEMAKSLPQTPIASPSPVQEPQTVLEKSHKKGQSKKALIEQPQMLPNLITDKAMIDDLRSFYKSKSPENNIEIFATLTFWLKDKSQLPDVSISEMWTLYKILGVKPPKVLIQVFRDGKSKKAYFEAAKATGRYYLTPFGETFVEHDLPKVQKGS